VSISRFMHMNMFSQIAGLVRTHLAFFFEMLALSSTSWGGLALLAQLERRFVRLTGRLEAATYNDIHALAWLLPGAVADNAATLVGQALYGRAGAIVARTACMLPYILMMTAFAVIRHASILQGHYLTLLISHFRIVLCALVASAVVRQLVSIRRQPGTWVTGAMGFVLMFLWPHPAIYVLSFVGAFIMGWASCKAEKLTASGGSTRRFSSGLVLYLCLLAACVTVYAFPIVSMNASLGSWIRLPGAGLTLFGGGFAAIPVLDSVFGGIIDPGDFSLAFALSALSPGPLLNVAPFLGYLTGGIPGALLACVVLFAPTTSLAIFVYEQMRSFSAIPRFGSGMSHLRAAAIALLGATVVHMALRLSWPPLNLGIGLCAFALLYWKGIPVWLAYLLVAMLTALQSLA